MERIFQTSRCWTRRLPLSLNKIIQNSQFKKKAKVENQEKYKSETSITKLWRLAWENWIKSSDKESKGIVRPWTRKRYLLPVERTRPVRKETDAVSATNPKIVRKNQSTLPPHLLSQPHHEVEVCRGREVSEAKVTMGPFFDKPCRYCLKGTCTRTLCEYWHPPECHFYKNATGCKAGDKCLFPHYKVDEQPNKKAEKEQHPKMKRKRRQECCAFVKSVSLLGCVSQHSDALVSQGRKSRRNPMQKVLEPIQRVRFTKSTLRHASIQEKNWPSLGKIHVKVPHQRSPNAMKFEDRSHEETERQQRCVQSKAWDLAKKYLQAQRERKGYIPLARGGMVTPSCVNKRAGGKRVCSWFRSDYAYGQ